MEEINGLITNGHIDDDFVERLQELVNRRSDAMKVQPVFSLLWTHCSSLKNKNATFVQSLENSVVILLKFLLEAESIISNAKLKSSCLRVATNFCVIYHQQGYGLNTILDTTISFVVSLIKKNKALANDTVSQYLNHLIALQTACLAQSNKLSVGKRHETWNNLVCLFELWEDKSKLIALLCDDVSNPEYDMHYLKTCIKYLTEKYVDKIFQILDKYFSYSLTNNSTTSLPLDLASTILNNVISEIENKCNSKSERDFQSTMILLYKYSLETACQITKSKEDHLYESLATLNNKFTVLFKLLGKYASNPLSGKLVLSILTHLYWTQTKYICQFRKPATVQLVLEMYQNFFKLANMVSIEQCNAKSRNQMLFQCWYVCLTLITDNLNLDHLYGKFAQALTVIDGFITEMLLSSFRKEELSSVDRSNFRCYVTAVSKLSTFVCKIDARNMNRALNSDLMSPVLKFFLAVPEELIVTYVADYMVLFVYNCLKPIVSESNSLESGEPLVLLACHSVSLASSVPKYWIRLQNMIKNTHAKREWVHLCHHIERVLPQLQLKFPDVTFVDTCGVPFVQRVVKSELDEVLSNTPLPLNTESTTYEAAVVERVLFLIQTDQSSPIQDLSIVDVCLSCLSIINMHDQFTEESSKIKAYVAELNKEAKASMKISLAADVVDQKEIVTRATLVRLLLANYSVLEHMEMTEKERAEQKKQSKSYIETKKQVVNDLDKGIEQSPEANLVFPNNMNVFHTSEWSQLLNTAALILAKVTQFGPEIDVSQRPGDTTASREKIMKEFNKDPKNSKEKISSITKMERVVDNILYVAYSYRLCLEENKEIEFWKLALQLSVLLQQDALFVTCVYNLLWLDQGLKPQYIKRADEITTATSGKDVPDHVKIMYQFAKVKQALSLNQVSKASEDFSKIPIELKDPQTIREMLLLSHYWYLKCLILMKQSDLTPVQHGTIAQSADVAFKCLFRNFDAVSHISPQVVQVFSCYLNITTLITRFHTAHMNPKEAKAILSAAMTFTQDLCLPLWTAKLLSLSASLDVITCNTEELSFKTSCLERFLTVESSSEANAAEQKQGHVESKAEKMMNSNPARVPDLLMNPGEAMRDAVVTKQTITSSSLASPRFVSTLSNKLPDFISNRSCNNNCFQCRNSVYHELLISLELLRAMNCQLAKDYEVTAFCIQNAEHLLNKLKILKGLPEDIATQWHSRLVFYRANLEGIQNRPANVLKIHQELQLTSVASEDYFDRYFEIMWQQEQYLMYMGAEIQVSVEKVRTPPRRVPPVQAPQIEFKTPRVSRLNIAKVLSKCGATAMPAWKLDKDVVTPSVKERRKTLVFDDEDDDGNTKDDETKGNGKTKKTNHTNDNSKDDSKAKDRSKVKADTKTGNETKTKTTRENTAGNKKVNETGVYSITKGKALTNRKEAVKDDAQMKDGTIKTVKHTSDKSNHAVETDAYEPLSIKFDDFDKSGKEVNKGQPGVMSTARRRRRVKMDDKEEEKWSPKFTYTQDTKKYTCYGSVRKQNPAASKAPVESFFTPLVTEKFASTQLSPRSSRGKSRTTRRKVLFQDENDGVETGEKTTVQENTAKKTTLKENSVEENTAKETTVKVNTVNESNVKEYGVNKGATLKDASRLLNDKRKLPRDVDKMQANSKVITRDKQTKSRTTTSNSNNADDNMDELSKSISDLQIKSHSEKMETDLNISDASSYHSCSPSPELEKPTGRKAGKALQFDDEDMDVEQKPLVNEKSAPPNTKTAKSGLRKPAPIASKFSEKNILSQSKTDESNVPQVKAVGRKPLHLASNNGKVQTSKLTKPATVKPDATSSKVSVLSGETSERSVNGVESKPLSRKIQLTSNELSDSSVQVEKTSKTARSKPAVSSTSIKTSDSLFTNGKTSKSSLSSRVLVAPSIPSSSPSPSESLPRRIRKAVPSSNFSSSSSQSSVSQRASSQSEKSAFVSSKSKADSPSAFSYSSVESLPVASGRRYRKVVLSSGPSQSSSAQSDRCSSVSSNGVQGTPGSVQISSASTMDTSSSLSPVSVESLPVPTPRLRGRKVIISSSSSVASSQSDGVDSVQPSSRNSPDCDSFHSVDDTKENEPPHNQRGRGLKNRAVFATPACKALKDEETFSTPACKALNDGDIFLTPAVPKSEKPKRKPRAQFPKSPFIF